MACTQSDIEAVCDGTYFIDVYFKVKWLPKHIQSLSALTVEQADRRYRRSCDSAGDFSIREFVGYRHMISASLLILSTTRLFKYDSWKSALFWLILSVYFGH